jgi:hypothetical protein
MSDQGQRIRPWVDLIAKESLPHVKSLTVPVV